MNFTPKTRIIHTDNDKFQNSYGLKKWANLQNMKEVSRVINILSKYAVEDNNGLENMLMSEYARLGSLSENLNSMNTEIEELSLKIKVAKQAKKFELLVSQRKSLTDKFDKEYASEIHAHQKAVRQLFEWFPDGKFPTPESMERKRNALKEERSAKNEEYSVLKSKITELNYARQTLDDYLKNERNVQEHRKKKGELE